MTQERYTKIKLNLVTQTFFDLNKINTHDEVDTEGLCKLGFDFKTAKINENKVLKNDKFKFSIGQIISATRKS